MMQASLDIRPSPIAGRWYTADPRRLAAEVDGYLDAAQLPALAGEVIAVMAPHAGHRYSGPVAGYAFAALRGLSPDLVAIVSPMHYPYAEPLLTTSHHAYATPLGNIPVDQAALQSLDGHLVDRLGYSLAYVAHDPEHSLEIELPFLQRLFPAGFGLLPIMVREQSSTVARQLGQALALTLNGRNAILVASTDLSHFYTQSEAQRLDAELLERVAAFDPQGVIRVDEQGKGFACGRGALAAMLWAAQALGADQVQVLNHATSGDVTGDFSQVVGYAAAVALRRNLPTPQDSDLP
jgi:hypothetical protein